MTDQKKIDEVHSGVQDIKIELAKFLVHQEQHRKEIDDLKADSKKMVANQNWFFGVCSILGIGLSAFFAWMFKH